jgi:hypothetical protein
MAKAARDPDVKRRLGEVGAEVMGSTQEELGKVLREQVAVVTPAGGGAEAGRAVTRPRRLTDSSSVRVRRSCSHSCSRSRPLAAHRYYWYGEDLDLLSGRPRLSSCVERGLRYASMRAHGEGALRIAAIALAAIAVLLVVISRGRRAGRRAVEEPAGRSAQPRPVHRRDVARTDAARDLLQWRWCAGLARCPQQTVPATWPWLTTVLGMLLAQSLGLAISARRSSSRAPMVRVALAMVASRPAVLLLLG